MNTYQNTPSLINIDYASWRPMLAIAIAIVIFNAPTKIVAIYFQKSQRFFFFICIFILAISQELRASPNN